MGYAFYIFITPFLQDGCKIDFPTYDKNLLFKGCGVFRGGTPEPPEAVNIVPKTRVSDTPKFGRPVASSKDPCYNNGRISKGGDSYGTQRPSL